MHHTLLVISFLRTRRSQTLLFLPISMLHGLSTLLLPLVTGAFFDVYYNTSTGKSRLLNLIGISLNSITQFFVFFGICILIKAVLSYIEKRLADDLSNQFSWWLTTKLFTTQLSWPNSYFRQKAFGKYLLRYSGDLNAAKNLLVKGWLGTVKHSSIFLTGLGLLFLIHAQLTLQLILTLLVVSPLAWFISKQQKTLTVLRNQKSSLLSFITESFSNHEQIELHNKQKKIIHQFGKKQEKIKEAADNSSKKQSLIFAFTSVMGYAVVAILLLWVVAIPNLSISTADILVYMLILFTLLSTIRSLLRLPEIFQKGNLSLKKVSDILSANTDQNRGVFSNNFCDSKQFSTSVIKNV